MNNSWYSSKGDDLAIGGLDIADGLIRTDGHSGKLVRASPAERGEGAQADPSAKIVFDESHDWLLEAIEGVSSVSPGADHAPGR